MIKQVGITGLIIFLGISLLQKEIEAEVAGNIQEPLSLSEEAINTTLALKVEETWLLWKLKRKKEAYDMGMSLLEEHPGDKEVLEVAVLLFLDKGRLAEAEEYLEKLEKIAPNGLSAKTLRADLYLRQKKWEKAFGSFAALAAQDPGNMDYQAGYAEVLYNMKRWNEARELYELLKNDRTKRKDYIWAYRVLLEEYGQGVSINGRYLQAVGGLWEYQINEKATFYPLKSLRTEIEVFQETYRQKSTGAESISRSPAGHKVTLEWDINEQLKLGGYLESSYVDMKNANEFGASLKMRSGNMYNEIEAGFNKLMRSPVEALKQRARESDIKITSEVMLAERVKLGHIFESSWYRIKSGQNSINNKKEMGYIISSTISSDFIILTEPFFSLNIMYKYAHWEQSFSRANETFGLFPEERQYSGGCYFEHKIADILNISGSVNRNYDHKREVYSTYSVFKIEYWFKDNARTSFTYENQYGDSGLNGAGNTQTASAGIDLYF